MNEFDTTPLREMNVSIDEDGCRILSVTPADSIDGAAQRLFDIIKDASDLGSTSDELAGQAQTWMEHYHLGHDRANVLRPLALQRGFRVLEVGAGCGAITRYLGEKCDVVDAVESDPARARVARVRTRDLPGVEVFVGDIFDVNGDNAYDVIVMVGVLEYVGEGSADLAPYRRFLHRAASLLADDGTLLVAIENRVGVKYLAGASEDHSNRPFDSLEGYPNGSRARTFSRGALESLIGETSLIPRVLSAFPDYKLTRIIMSDELLTADASLAYRIPHFPSPDWGGFVERVANEGAMWRTMIEAGLGSQTANSFVVLASRQEQSSLWPEELLAAYYSTGRRALYTSETRVVHEDGHIVFDRHSVADDVTCGRAPVERGSTPVHYDQSDGRVQLRLVRAPWIEGTDFLDLLSDANDKELIDWLGKWMAVLAIEIREGQPVPIDLLPHNLVALSDGTLRVIDSKFVQMGVSREAIVARGALVTGMRLARMTRPDRWGVFTVEGVVRYLGTLIGLPPDGTWMPDAVAYEAAFQTEVSLHTPEPPNRVEAMAMQAAELWGELRRPLALSSRRGPGIDNQVAVEAELIRMGGAYGTLVDSHDALVSAHRTTVEHHAREHSLLLSQLADAQSELFRTHIDLHAHVAEFARIKASSSWKFTRPFRAVTQLFRRTSSRS